MKPTVPIESFSDYTCTICITAGTSLVKTCADIEPMKYHYIMLITYVDAEFNVVMDP